MIVTKKVLTTEKKNKVRKIKEIHKKLGIYTGNEGLA